MSEEEEKLKQPHDIDEIERVAQETIKTRRENLQPHGHGLWRGFPNPHTVGYLIDDDEL